MRLCGTRKCCGVRSASLRPSGQPSSGQRLPFNYPVLLLFVLSCLVPTIFACAENDRQVTPDPTHFQWPVGIVGDPNGKFVYVISTNFDSAGTGGTVVAVDTETLKILPESAAKIGSFGGEPSVSALADGRSRIWIPIRDNDSLDFVDIDYVTGDAGEYPAFSCDLEDSDETVVLQQCTADFRLPVGDLVITDEDKAEYYADNPYGSASGDYLTLADGRNVHPVYMAGITGAVLNIFLADDAGVVEYKTGVLLSTGTHSVVEYKISDSDRVVWISNHAANEIAVVRVHIDRRGGVTAWREISTSADLLGSSGDYFRGIARSSVSPMLYAAYRSPAGMAAFEVNGNGFPVYRGLVALDGTPSGVAVHVAADGTETVYVTEATWSLVYAIDPVRMTVIDEIFVGKSPYGIAIVNDRAFVTNFEDSSVSVISLDSASDDYHTEISQIL